MNATGMSPTLSLAASRLLEKARSQFTSPRLEARQDALESLWDGFERLKPRNTEARGENPGFDDANPVLDK